MTFGNKNTWDRKDRHFENFEATASELLNGDKSSGRHSVETLDRDVDQRRAVQLEARPVEARGCRDGPAEVVQESRIGQERVFEADANLQIVHRSFTWAMRKHIENLIIQNVESQFSNFFKC